MNETVTESVSELPLAPPPGRLRRFYRWLAVASALVLAASMGLGYLGAATMPLGATGAWLSVLAGVGWLARQPRLARAVVGDFVFLGLGAMGTLAGAGALLLAPDFYGVYWFGLGVLFGGALFFARAWQRAVWSSSVVVLVFFVVPVFLVRSAGVVRAVESGSGAHAHLFLAFGADANLRKQHDPLLVMAARAGDATSARVLLDYGADPNGRSSAFLASTPALAEAAASGSTELIALLLDRGATTDLANSWGETALGRAARAGQARAVRLLLSRGADPDRADDHGRRPVEAARAAGHSEIERMLLDANPAGAR